MSLITINISDTYFVQGGRMKKREDVWGIVEQWGGGGQEIEKKNWEVVEKKGNA
jgi:hypothetical protein